MKSESENTNRETMSGGSRLKLFSFYLLPFTFYLLVFSFPCQAQTTTHWGISNNTTPIVWLHSDDYNASLKKWPNKITGAGTGMVGDFINPSGSGFIAPSVIPGYNFNRSVVFTKSGSGNARNRLDSEYSRDLANDNNITAIFVHKRKTNGDGDHDFFSFTYGTAANNGNIVWNYASNSANNAFTVYWNHTNDNLTTFGNNRNEGILTVDIANVASSPTAVGVYLNGGDYTGKPHGGKANYNYRWILGAGYGGGWGYEGEVQEVIILKSNNTTTNHMDPSDLQRIHSYLAIKYGITLNNDSNYVNSSGVPVWTRTKTPGLSDNGNIFNSNIFGIGRDDASGLNQLQSRSLTADMLTIYKTPSLGVYNNSTLDLLPDNTFLMLGGNGLLGNENRSIPLNTSFANGTTGENVNYVSKAIYRAQVTGVPGDSMTVNIKLVSTSAKYVLVSTSSTFPAGAIGGTRIYPVGNLIAENVVIHSGEYITTAGLQTVPGGAVNTVFAAWLTPDSYYNGTWTNKIAGAVGDFIAPSTAPAVTNAGYNYHPSVVFTKDNNNNAKNRLVSQSVGSIAATDNISIFFVLKRNTATNYSDHDLWSFRTTGSDNLGHIVWNNAHNNSNYLAYYWPSSERVIGTANSVNEGIITLDNANSVITTSGGGIDFYLNGASNTRIQSSSVPSSQPYNTQWMLGAAYENAVGNGYGYVGTIQEVIVAKAPGTNQHMAPDELQKIHTYLALKYGITLNNSDNYLNSDGAAVWTRDANYNSNIFGLGRDDFSGLYQKQSSSLTNQRVQIYVGPALRELNSQNTATIPDGQYLVIGHNGQSGFSDEFINTGEVFENTIMTGSVNFKSKAIYKVQVTGANEFTFNMNVSVTYNYVQVSKNAQFTPSDTRIYPVNSLGVAMGVVVDNAHPYIRFVGRSIGPGGVGLNLKLWLRADNSNMLTIENTNTGDLTVSGYPLDPTDGSTVPAVTEWTDFVRNQSYTYANAQAANSATAKKPVFKPSSPEMNFHPAVRFYATSSYSGSYLRNNGSTPPMVSSPNRQTAIFVTNNDFTPPNTFVYPMSFGSQIAPGTSGNYAGPQYGVQALNGKMTGRLRIYTASDDAYGVVIGQEDLFKPGATSVLYYGVEHNSSTTRTGWATFRFNGKEERKYYDFPSGANLSTFNMNTYSIISGGFAPDRIVNGVIAEAIIYEDSLSEASRTRVESYLALKYGITVRQNGTGGSGRFDYTINGGVTMVWEGTRPDGDKFAKYYHNIAAVARDDSTYLNNRQAHSTDPGSILHLGVAGTQLGASSLELGELQDNEAVAFGCDTATGISAAAPICGEFTYVFNRKWLVHKVANRDVTMLVGGEDNRGNSLGRNLATADTLYYRELGKPQNKFYLLVASDPGELDSITGSNGNYQIIPMEFINGEHQCAYTFTDSCTYVTFAYTSAISGAGCASTVDFQGTKTFNWPGDLWHSSVHGQTGPLAASGIIFDKPPVDIGDQLNVRATVDYPSGVQASYGFPQAVFNNSLKIQRSYGNTVAGLTNKVTAVIEFLVRDTLIAAPNDTLVQEALIPEFQIYGLDAQGKQYDKVTITGWCGSVPPSPGAPPATSGGQPVYPRLTTGSTQPTFSIAGNTATVNKNLTVGDADKSGMLNVAFEDAVRWVSIEYEFANQPNQNVQSIVISPFTLRSGVPSALMPPQVNSDGVGFWKQAAKRALTACEDVEYVFYIQNANRQEKYFKLQDRLPDYMSWKEFEVSLDSINSNGANDANGNKRPNISYLRSGQTLHTLTIDSLLVPCASILKITATARMDETAPGGEYANNSGVSFATLEYAKANGLQKVSLASIDYDTHEDKTAISVTASTRALPVVVDTIYASHARYNPGETVTVTLKLDNPNPALSDIFLNINWGANFNYLPASLSVTAASGAPVTCHGEAPLSSSASLTQNLIISGNTAGDMGFQLGAGVTEITFKVVAPDKITVPLDSVGNGSPDINPLLVFWNISSDSPDACTQRAVENIKMELEVPYGTPLYINTITDNFGPNTGGAYTRNSGLPAGNPAGHWGIDPQGTVTIVGGDNFTSGNIEVTFGGVLAHIIYRSKDTLICIPPAVADTTVWNTNPYPRDSVWREGFVDVVLTSPSATYTLENGYAYHAPMTITGFSPDASPTAGGKSIAIIGHNFYPPIVPSPDSIKVVFAKSPADAVEVWAKIISDNRLLLTTGPHPANHVTVTVDNGWEKTDTANAFTYFPTVFIENGSWTEFKKWEDHTDEDILPYPKSVIHIKANCVQDTIVDMDSITVYPGKAYTLNSGKTLDANVFTLKDDASFLNYGTMNAVEQTAEHLLAKGRNWYVSSPVKWQLGTSSPIELALGRDTLGNDLVYASSKWYVELYDESDHYGGLRNDGWKLALAPGSNNASPFTAGMGYTAYSQNKDIAARFSGKYNDTDVPSPLLTRQDDPHPKRGFNLVGNPFPSYWRWTADAARLANVYSTIWYRTNVGMPPTDDDYQFWAYNASGNVAVAPGWDDITQTTPYSLAYIPPLQAFWVRVMDGQGSGTLTFENNRRSHADHSANILKSSVAETRPMLRLSVSSDKHTDETLVYADTAATAGFDNYDSDKWFTGRGAEIYTLPASESRELAINAFPAIAAGTEIPLGFRADEGGVFSFRAGEILNLDTLDVVLHDKWRHEKFDLHSGDSYYFTSGSAPNVERFSIAFQHPAATGLLNAESKDKLLAYSNKAGQITVLLQLRDIRNSGIEVSVFDIAGRKLAGQQIIAGKQTALEGAFDRGVYVLRAGKWTTKVAVK